MSTHNIHFRGEIRKISAFSDEKSALSIAIFLISPRKHMLWVLISSASGRHF